MSMMSEFKDFAVKGNVMDMAVGIIIGAAFGKIVSAFVNGVVMPPLGLLLGGVSFTELKHVIKPATEATAEVAIMYGEVVQTVIDFTIIAFAIFMVIRFMNSLKKEAEEEAPAEPARQEVLLEEIRDALKKKPAAKAAASKAPVRKTAKKK